MPKRARTNPNYPNWDVSAPKPSARLKALLSQRVSTSQLSQPTSIPIGIIGGWHTYSHRMGVVLEKIKKNINKTYTYPLYAYGGPIIPIGMGESWDSWSWGGKRCGTTGVRFPSCSNWENWTNWENWKIPEGNPKALTAPWMALDGPRTDPADQP